MRFKDRVCIIATVLLMAGLTCANTSWSPLDPNATINGYSDWTWTVGGQINWGGGMPTVLPGLANSKAVINSLPECRVTSLVGCNVFAMGDAGSGNAVLRIRNGGTLYTQELVDTDSWSAVGYSVPATLIVESGGTLQICGRFGIGWFTAATGTSQLLVNGGHVVIGAINGGNLQLGADTSVDAPLHPGYINVTQGGLIEVKRVGTRGGGLVFNNSDGSNINLEFGSIVFDTNVKTLLDTRIAGGKVKGFGGLTTPTAVYAGGRTTLTAPDPMNRNPAYEEVLFGSTNLTWTNMAPIPPATDVWVDVWFGTDPNKLNPAAYTKVVDKGKNTTSVTVNAPLVTEPTTYYWQVDSYLKGDPAIIGDPNVTATGLVTPFDVTSNTSPSVVINTPRTVTWINQPIQLDSTLTDDGNSAVTYLWTSDDPNAVFTPSATAADPAVSVNWHTADFTVTVTVDDGFNPPVTSGTVTMHCAENACQATTAVLNYDDAHKGDTALDCKLNLSDLAVYASNWLLNYQLTAPVPN